MSWIPFAVSDAGPADKQGYPFSPSPQPKVGVVLHSMVGSYLAARGRLMGPDRASWHFSVRQTGTIYQHYDSEAVCWHCGVAAAPPTPSNINLIGVELEGGPLDNVSEPLTPIQYQATLDLLRWAWEAHGFDAPALRATLWEHRRLSPTACPSGRIPWGRLIADLTTSEEDDMARTVRIVRAAGDPQVYVVDLATAAKRPLNGAQVDALYGLFHEQFPWLIDEVPPEWLDLLRTAVVIT